jgi:hypothetical protein
LKGGPFSAFQARSATLAQCIPIVCRVAWAYAATVETMIMLKEHHPDDWHAAYRGWAVIAIMLVGMAVLAALV